MKLCKIFILLLLMSQLLTGCGEDDFVVLSLPAYTHREYYTEGGFQDFTNYGVYYLEPFEEKKLEENPYFEKVADPEDLCSYIDNFEGWITAGSELAAHYHFDKTCIDVSDYVYIDTKEGDPIGNGGHTYRKFDHYNVYFFDLDSWTLYYFHSNI